MQPTVGIPYTPILQLTSWMCLVMLSSHLCNCGTGAISCQTATYTQILIKHSTIVPDDCSHQGQGLKAAKQALASKSLVLCLPADLLARIISESGTGAPAAAIACKAMRQVWSDNPAFHARLALQCSSSLPRVTLATRPKMDQCLLYAEQHFGEGHRSQLQLMWLKLHVEGPEPGVGYAACNGMHAGEDRCRIKPSHTTTADIQRLREAAASGDIKAATALISKLGKLGVQANGNAAMHAAARHGHTDMVDLLHKGGGEHTHGTTSPGVFLEQVRAGNIGMVKHM